jgi:hypothetical protein
LANRIRKKSHAVLQLRDALELKGRPAPRDTRQTDIKVLCTLRLARIFATWSLQVDGTIRALGPIVMSYPVRTRLTAREGIGGMDHDERRGTDFLGWFYAPPHARHDSGVTWTRHANTPPTTSRGWGPA